MVIIYLVFFKVNQIYYIYKNIINYKVCKKTSYKK